jgi:hypothetical protein
VNASVENIIFFANAKVILLYCDILSHRYKRLGRNYYVFFANAKVILLYCGFLSHRYEHFGRYADTTKLKILDIVGLV